MKKIIEKYLDGDRFAKDTLLEEIMSMHDYSITKHEAEVLLYQKYGTA